MRFSTGCGDAQPGRYSEVIAAKTAAMEPRSPTRVPKIEVFEVDCAATEVRRLSDRRSKKCQVGPGGRCNSNRMALGSGNLRVHDSP